MPHDTLIDVDALAGLIAHGAVFVMDCAFDLADPAAGRAGYGAGHIPGARYFHLDDDLSAPPSGTNGRHPLPDPDAFAARLRAVGLKAGQQVVAYDDAGGPYAARAWWLLRWIGHDRVAVLDGGLQAWRASGQPIETGTPADAPPGDFAAGRIDPARTVNTDQVLANIAGGDRLVIDARTLARWRGEPNALDPVSGHIPGSRSRWFKDNLDAEGRFRPAADLACAFDAVLGDTAPTAVILQCGSGVTACHNALAMELAGRPGASLYPGSWSEWVSDPARPVARES